MEDVKSILIDAFIKDYNKLLVFAQSMVESYEVAEEIVQEAYLRVAACTRVSRRVKRPYLYCCRAVRNAALDYFRRIKKEAEYIIYPDDFSLDSIEGECNLEDQLYMRDLIEKVDKVLEDVPEEERKVFLLYFLYGLTQREIGKELGCSVASINIMLREVLRFISEQAPPFDIRS